MALRLSASSKNIGRNQENSYAKFAIIPHQHGQVMVEQIRKKNQLEAGKSSQSNSRVTSSRHISGQHP
jgi:hypothetical protein